MQHSVTLNWNRSTSKVTGYNVYPAGTAAGPYAKLNSSPDASNAYTDTTAASQTYYYVTTAVNSSGVESSYSNQVQVTIP